MAYGVTPQGYVIKLLSEINAEVEQALLEVKDPETGQSLIADLSNPSDIVSQIVAIITEQIGIAWQNDQAAYNQFNPGGATDDALSTLCQLNGVTRKAASAGTVLLDFTGTPSVNIPEGINVTDVNRVISWRTTQPFTFDGSGDAIDVPAECNTLGVINATANTLTQLVNSNSNITTVTNPLPATAGQNEELDRTLRKRRDASTEKSANGLPEAINANILQVEGVTFSREYTNNTTAIDSNGIPAKTFAAVVVGGDDEDVARAIFQSITSGQATDGNTMVTFVDQLNNDNVINFYRPTSILIDVIVNLTLTNDEAFPDNGVDLIKQAIVDYSIGGARALGITSGFDSIGFPPGQDVILSRLYTPVNSVPGHQIDSILIAADPDPPAAADVPIGFNEVSVFDIGNITVLVS